MVHNQHETALIGILTEILVRSSAQGLSNAELARRADIAPESLSRLKKTGRADFGTIFKLAEIVDFDIIVRPKESYLTRLERGFF
jgi:DNA-binding Xre family transcriptional regulator